jgi:RecA-family ATPase
MATEFAQIIEPLAKWLLGEPNPAMSSRRELRYGAHGSLSVDLTKGTWFDHEANEGGGALDLVTRETKLIGEERLDWLKQHGFAFDTIQPNGGERASIVATYDYVDEGGGLLTQVCRFEPKDFRQRRPDGNGGWVWSVKGVRHVPYRLPQLFENDSRIVCIVEGEKDVDRLWKLGVPATCNAGGAGKWRDELNEFFREADVVIIPDRDPQKRHPKTGDLMFHPDGKPILPGQDHAQAVARSLHGIAARVRVLELWESWPDMPMKGDVSDWIAHGGSAEQLYALIEQLPEWSPDREAEQSETPPALVWISTATWDIDPIPEQDWTVRERFPRRQCGLFSGEGAAGKSTLLLQLCSSAAIARDWLGTMPEPGPTLFIDAEDDADVIHRRLAAVAKHYDVTFKALADGGLHLMSLAGQDAVLATISKGGKIAPTPLYAQLLQAAGDIKPVIIGLASSANFFAGNEVDRAQVQQFISLMTKLALVANGTTVLISHPSLTGISSDSGLSGNTQWHKSVRARCYIRGVKREGDEPTETDSDLREIFWKKSNYGPVSESIVLRWQNGLFLPIKGVSSLDQVAQAALADDVFLAVLKRLTQENRFVSDKPSAIYAPSVFAEEAEAKKARTGSAALTAAMRRLFEARLIWNQPWGKPSRPSFRIAIKQGE